ncbi:MAG: hypothetical protein ACOYM3_14085 [Terrimicrobiaceae bacterium]
MITSLLALVLRIALLCAMTFLFVVLFEHGPTNYVDNVQSDFNLLFQAVAGPAPSTPGK